jgi:hypothetical protein
MRTYPRDDVETHDGYPAVNVKVYGDLSDGFKAYAKYAPADGGDYPAEFDEDWVRANVSDKYLDELFWDVCSFEFEMVEQDAEEILGDVKVSREGRSGGWAVVTGLPNLEDWDAVQLAKWRKFERYAKLVASDVPYQMVMNVYLNEYQWRIDEEAERERAACQDIATL